MSTAAYADFLNQNRQGLRLYFGAAAIALLAIIAYFIFNERYLFLILLGAAPVAVFFLTRPDWAAYQFLFFMFYSPVVVEEINLSVADFSAILVILAAMLDVLLHHRLPRHFPPLFFNLIFLLGAVCVAAAFSFDVTAAANSMTRLSLMITTFVALYHLAGKFDIKRLLMIFFWLAVLHSVAVLIPFVAAGGGMRSFGLIPHMFDDMAMLALPVGAALYVWSRPGYVAWYGLAATVVFAALVATQSRLSIMFGVFILAATVVVSAVQLRLVQSQTSHAGETQTLRRFARSGRRRTLTLVATLTVAIGVAVAAMPDVLTGVLDRFRQVLSDRPTGTLRTRMELWQTALTAFRNYPVLGIGPGVFRQVSEVFPLLHMTHYYLWVRGLSAHNLFFHYLAETGVVGTSFLVALFVNQFRYSRRIWKSHRTDSLAPFGVALTMVSSLLLVTMFIEAGWMWGHLSHSFVFFLAIIAGQYAKDREAGV